jgi:hypothetical protein
MKTYNPRICRLVSPVPAYVYLDDLPPRWPARVAPSLGGASPKNLRAWARAITKALPDPTEDELVDTLLAFPWLKADYWHELPPPSPPKTPAAPIRALRTTDARIRALVPGAGRVLNVDKADLPPRWPAKLSPASRGQAKTRGRAWKEFIVSSLPNPTEDELRAAIEAFPWLTPGDWGR